MSNVSAILDRLSRRDALSEARELARELAAQLSDFTFYDDDGNEIDVQSTVRQLEDALDQLEQNGDPNA